MGPLVPWSGLALCFSMFSNFCFFSHLHIVPGGKWVFIVRTWVEGKFRTLMSVRCLGGFHHVRLCFQEAGFGLNLLPLCPEGTPAASAGEFSSTDGWGSPFLPGWAPFLSVCVSLPQSWHMLELNGNLVFWPAWLLLCAQWQNSNPQLLQKKLELRIVLTLEWPPLRHFLSLVSLLPL